MLAMMRPHTENSIYINEPLLSFFVFTECSRVLSICEMSKYTRVCLNNSQGTIYSPNTTSYPLPVPILIPEGAVAKLSIPVFVNQKKKTDTTPTAILLTSNIADYQIYGRSSHQLLGVVNPKSLDTSSSYIPLKGGKYAEVLIQSWDLELNPYPIENITYTFLLEWTPTPLTPFPITHRF